VLLDSVTGDAWKAYREAMSGFPTGGLFPTGGVEDALDHPVRMIYFSAITMTTVGHGDILPLTYLSRSLAGFQAIMGIVWAGAFLNAIA